MMEFEKEEHQLKEENIRLQRKLFLEMERREALSRQLSESESSLEMDEERFGYLFVVNDSTFPHIRTANIRNTDPDFHNSTSLYKKLVQI